MSLAGARGLARISQNPRCDLQTAMVINQVNEVKFYKALTGKEFEGEYGERTSARRRGRMFETNLYQNDAAELRRTLGPRFGYNPEDMSVRNLVDEIPDHMKGARQRRYMRVVQIFASVAAGLKPSSVPHLLIEPQLRLSVSDNHFIYITPDFAIFDPQAECYVVGEVKSMIVRAGSPERADLERARRQAGAEVLALQLLAKQLGIIDRLQDRANFIFASPFGVIPHPPVEENLHAEVSEIRKALESCRRVNSDLEALMGQGSGKDFVTYARTLRFTFQNTCMSSCALLSYCKARISDTTQVLGDEATDAFGPTTELKRLYELMLNPESARSAEEVSLAARLKEAREVLGVDSRPVSERIRVR